jgi:hypothetical protein
MITADNKDEGYTASLPLWMHVRAAIRGKQGAMELVRNDDFYGVTPPNYRKTQDNYNEVSERERKYFGRGRFSNFTGRTHDAYVGMVGSVPVESKLPAKIEGIEDNVDGENSTINDFALEIASELLITARYGALSNPAMQMGQTQSIAGDALPSIIGYKAEQIIYHRVDNGQLVEVRLVESYWKQVNNYDWELQPQLRRLYLDENGDYTSEVWRDKELFDIESPVVNGSALKYIPFQFYGSENNKPTYDRPVMFDLAHQNLGHFQLDCDNRDNLHYHGQGMTNIFTDNADDISENNPGGIDVGAKGKNIWSKDDRVELLQLEATGAIATEMERDEKRMIMLGAQVVQDSSSTQTLGAKQIESNASTSQLKRISLNTSAGLTQNLKWCAEFAGANADEVIIKVNTKFITDDLTAQDVQQVFAAVQGGDLPKESLIEAHQKAGYTDKTKEEIEELLEEEANNGTSEEVAGLLLRIEQLEAANSGGGDE